MELAISDYIQMEDAINIRFGKDHKIWYLNPGSNVLRDNLPSKESIPPLVSITMFYHKNKSFLVKLPAVFAILHETGLRTNL